MSAREIGREVYAVGAIDWDRRLFDELIPLPDGTSYNAYVVKGKEKTALIDTVDPTMEGVLLQNLSQLDIKNIDYVIANHAEQDHSGSLPAVLKIYPRAKLVCNPRCKAMLIDLLLISEDRFITVDDGESLSLGDRMLEFIYTPWVHWPETMVTYLREAKVLFSCDFFGSHLATSDLYVADAATVYEAAKRYYAEIMMPFRTTITKNLEKIARLKIETIAPSHGPVHNKPDFILNAYRDWVSDGVKNEVVLPYISMHGSTRKMVGYFVDALIKRDITVKQFNLTRTDIGELAIALVDAATIVIGSPTVLGGPHPNVVYAACLVNALRPKLRFVSIIGSYGWGGRTVEVLEGLISSLKVEKLEPVIIKGFPTEEGFRALERLADEILTKHQQVGAIK